MGERTEETLQRLGLRTVSDIAHTPLDTLKRALGEAAGAHLHALAWGRDPRTVVAEHVEKSVGAEETFAQDVDDPEVVLREVLRLSERVAARLRAGDAVGRTVVLKVRFADFTTITRSRTLGEPTDVAPGRLRHAPATLPAARARAGPAAPGRRPGRGAGRRRERAPAAGPRRAPQGWREAERAVDRASARFGAGAVRPATLVPDGSNRSAGMSERRPAS